MYTRGWTTLCLTVLLFALVKGEISSTSAQDDTGVVATTSGNLNVRAGPSTNCEIVGSLPAYTTVPVTGRTLNAQDELWLLIPFLDGESWIAGWLVDIAGDIEDVPWGLLEATDDQVVADQANNLPPDGIELATTWNIKKVVQTDELLDHYDLASNLQQHIADVITQTDNPYLAFYLPGTQIVVDASGIQQQLLTARENFQLHHPDVQLTRPIGYQTVVITSSEMESFRKGFLHYLMNAARDNTTGTLVFDLASKLWMNLSISSEEVPPTKVIFLPWAKRQQIVNELQVTDWQDHIVGSRHSYLEVLKILDDGVLTLYVFEDNWVASSSGINTVLIAVLGSSYRGDPAVDAFWFTPNALHVEDRDLNENTDYPPIFTTEGLDWWVQVLPAFAAVHSRIEEMTEPWGQY